MRRFWKLKLKSGSSQILAKPFYAPIGMAASNKYPLGRGLKGSTL